jgi:hypothetical protein
MCGSGVGIFTKDYAMSEEQPRIPTLGEILGLDKEDTPQGKVFRLYVDLDIRTDEQLRALPVQDRYVWLIYRFDSNVQNGGIDSFFWNSDGEYLAECLEALQAIGAVRTYQMVKELSDLFPDGGPAVENETRQSQMRAILENPEGTEVRDFDDLIEFDWDENLFELLLEYRRRFEA